MKTWPSKTGVNCEGVKREEYPGTRLGPSDCCVRISEMCEWHKYFNLIIKNMIILIVTPNRFKG